MADNYRKQVIAFFLLSLLLIFTCNTGFAGPSKKLFIIHSYEQNHICGQPQHEGAMKAINESGWEVGKNLDMAVYYMDTKKKNNTPELIQHQAEKALIKIKRFNPDIILTLDDNAFRTVALPLAGTKISIVFSGINQQPENYNKIKHFMVTRKNPGSNITGIYEKLHVREAIQVLSNMLDLKKVLVLNDLSPTGKAISGQVKLELYSDQNKEPLPCKTEQRTIKSWEDYQNVIDMINSNPEIDAFYLGTLLLKDALGNTHTAPDIINYTINHAKKPAMGPNYAFIKMGLYGGASVDFFAMGYQAGQKVAAILNGADPGKLPIQDAQRIALVFNLSRAKALGIQIPDDILLAADEVFQK